MILLRSVQEKDFADLYELAGILNSLNLPHDRKLLRRNIRHAIASFRGSQKDKAKAMYTFVAEDTRTRRVVGTSSIFARHGAEHSPHIFFDVRREIRKSRTLNTRVRHRTLKLGFTKDGPTEVGGLVVKPGYRRLLVKVGRQLSLVRFLYMALHPGRFKKRVLCEFLPNFSRQGKSLLWEHCGRRFTGLDYHVADHLSATNKEFILSLFPHTKIYASLLPPEVQDIMEKTGDASLPAQKMLEGIGFRYLRQICPFDGGPHFGAQLADIAVLRKARFLELAVAPGKGSKGRQGRSRGLVLLDKKGVVRAVQTEFVMRGEKVLVEEDVMEMLRGRTGDIAAVYVFPLRK